MENKRIYLFDNLKFLLILSVVIGHFAEVGTGKSDIYKSIFLFIYTFHMPLFLFISGMLHKNKSITQKVVMYVSLGFVSKIVIFIARYIANGKASFSLLSDSYLPWYMFVMAMFIAMSYFLRNTNKVFVLIISVAVACFVGYDSSIGDYLYLSRFIVFYPFFVMGEMAGTRTVISINKNKLMKLVSVCIIGIWLILCFAKLDSFYVLRPLLTGRNAFDSKELFAVWGPLYRLLCYAVTCLVSLAIICLMPCNKLPFISSAGKKTLQIYFWHWPIALMLKKLGIQALLLETASGKLIWLIIALMLTVLLTVNLFGFPTNKIIKYSRQNKEQQAKE